MGKAVPAQMHATIPAGDDDDHALQGLAFQHLHDHRCRTGLAIIMAQHRAIGQDRGPGVMGRLGEFLV